MASENSADSRIPELTRISGCDVVLHIGCSERWARWVVSTVSDMKTSDQQVIQVDVLLKEGDGWGLCSQWRDNILEQLDGGDPARMLPDAPRDYRLGFSEGDAREMAEQMDTVVSVGADAHKFQFRLSESTAEDLMRQVMG